MLTLFVGLAFQLLNLNGNWVFGEANVEQLFTLGIIISNPNIDSERLIAEIKEEYQDPYHAENVSLRYQTNYNKIRLQINPVHSTGKGLNEVIQQLFCSVPSRGTNAFLFLIDEHSHASSVLLSKFMSTLATNINLPALAWSSSIVEFEDSTKFKFPMALLAPSVEHQAKATFAFLQKFLNQKRVTLMISSHTAGHKTYLRTLQGLSEYHDGGRKYSRFEFDSHQDHMSSRFIHMVHIDNSSIEVIRKELMYMRDYTDSRVFVLYCDFQLTDKIMEEANLLGMTRSEFIWILAKPAFVEPVPVNYAQGVIAMSYDTSYYVQMMALKAGIRVWSEAVRRLLLQYPDEETFEPVISCTRFSSDRWKYGEYFNQLVVKRAAYAAENEFRALKRIDFKVVQVSRHWKRVGGWSASNGVLVEDKKWRKNFNAEKLGLAARNFLRIVTLDETPYINYQLPQADGECPKNSISCRLSDDRIHTHVFTDSSHQEDYSAVLYHSNTTIVCCNGFVVDLLKRLSTDIGFNYEVFEVKDRKWGSVDKATGEWNGLVKALLNGTADIVATSLKINTERSNAIDFTVPFYQTGITILVRVREGVVSSIAFLEPFSLSTWLVVFLGCVNACSISIFVFENFARITNSQEENDDDQKTSSLFGSFWLVLSMLFNAAMKTDVPRSIGGRFVANIWAFFCVIFMSSFMANLAAFMITKEVYHDFSGLDDPRLTNPYSRNPPWKYATIPHGATEQLLKANYPEMHEHMKAYMKTDVDEGVLAVESNELDAFIYDASVLSYKAGRNCRLKTVGKWYAPTGYGFGLPKQSKWLQKINKQILDYQISGYLQHLEDYWLSGSCQLRFQQEKHKSTELGIANFSAAFAILGVALFICCVFFTFEHLFLKRCRDALKLKSRFWRLLTPSLATFSFRKTALTAFWSASHESNCSAPACRFRQQLLRREVDRYRDQVKNLQETQAAVIRTLVEGARESHENAAPLARFNDKDTDAIDITPMDFKKDICSRAIFDSYESVKPLEGDAGRRIKTIEDVTEQIVLNI